MSSGMLGVKTLARELRDARTPERKAILLQTHRVRLVISPWENLAHTGITQALVDAAVQVEIIVRVFIRRILASLLTTRREVGRYNRNR